MPLYLIPVDHDDSPVPVDKPILLIGRQAECDVILTCSRKVSRRHCCVVQVADRFVVRDLGSTNGISINGERIANESRFGVGDELTVGDVVFKMAEGKFDVPKGKVCIGPMLKSDGKAPAAEERPRRRGEFQGIPASRPRRDGVRDIDKAASEETRQRARDTTTKMDPVKPRNREELESEPEEIVDEFGSETFGSDHNADDMIAETFGSDIQDSVEPPAVNLDIDDLDDGDPQDSFEHDTDSSSEADDVHFGLLDENDSVSESQVDPHRRIDPRRKRPRKRRESLEPADDEQLVDFPFDDDSQDEDDEPRRPAPKRRGKRSPQDAKLNEDERFDDDLGLRDDPTKPGSQNAQDSIIELDEFDLLD